jgi:tetratricopeptide (TPR) repeat protein
MARSRTLIALLLSATALACTLVAILPSQSALAADIRPELANCPVYGDEFFGLEIIAVNTLKHRDGDFLLRAEGGNQDATWIWTCPYCFFSARPEVFRQGESVDFDPSSIETTELPEATKESELVQLRIPVGLKYRNAVAYYYSIGETPYFLGVLNLHGSWAARMSKVPMPKGLLGAWWKSYMKVTGDKRFVSEETQLLAIARDLRAKLRRAADKGDEGDAIRLKYLLASTLRQAGEHKQALPLLEELGALPDTSAILQPALREMELARTEAAFQEEALRYFKEAIGLKETLPEDRLQSIYLMGELSRRLGRYKDAEVWFKRASENPMPQRWARTILEMQKRRLAEDVAAGR